MFSHRVFSCLLSAVAVAAVICVTACAQNPIAGANVNMVSGTTWPGGDPFLERQNEPTIAVSTRNPLHLLAGSNDYSTVQLGVITDRVTGDAWLRAYRSTDGGWTWRSTLLPGCPYSTPECMGSPVRDAGYQVGADPTIRAGSNGMFYFNFVAFNRGDNAPGAVTLARFIDDNNSDRAGAEPIRYLGTTIIATNTSGRLTDKPWMAVDIPRPGAPTCAIPGTNGTPTQSFPAGNVYVAYAFIQGNDLNLRAKVYVATSTNCGVTFGKLIKVSEGSAIAQGAAVAVDPRPAPLGGALYVAWRQVQLQTNVNQPDAIMMVKSTDGGATFTKPAMVAAIEPFDQGASAVSFRTDSFPAMAVDETGRVYLVWQARVGPPASAPAAEKDARIVLSTSMDGLNWSAPAAVDEPPYTTYNPDRRGHQFMPSIAIAGGKVMVGYFDSRDDHTVGKLVCPKTTCNADEFVEVREPQGELPGSPGLVFNPFLADAIPPNYMSPLPQRRHTIDYRVAQASTTGSPQGFASTRVSQFLYGSPSKDPGVKPIQQLRFNVPNLPIFAKNTKGFIGDYTDAAALSMVPSGSGWAFNNTSSDAVVFHEVWTSNHDIRPPKDGNWANSSPPTYTGPFDPNLPRPTCTDPNRTGMKNQNIYTSRITQGLEVGAIQNAKKIATTDPNSPAFQRKFVVFVRNTKNKPKSYQLTFRLPLPAGVTASFKQTGPAVTTVDASITPRSTISQTVFLSSTDLTNSSPTVTVNVGEITGPGGAACDPSGCLHASVVLNADLTNTDLTNTDLTNTDLTNTDLTNADLTNTDLTNTDLTNTDLTNTDLTNTDLTNTDLTNMGVPVTDLTNADLTNTDLTNTDLTNTDLTNASMADATWKVTNKGNTGAAVSVKTLLKGGKLPQGYMAQLIVHKSYTTPAVAYGCDPKELTQTVVLANITSPKFLDPATAPITDLTNTDLTNTDLTNAVIPVGAGETVKVTLRFIVKDPAAPGVPKLCGPGLKPPNDVCASGDFNPVDNVKPVPVPQTVIPGVPGPAIALVITTMSLPDGTTGVGYDQTAQAIGGSGARTWSVTSGSLPGGFSLNPSTGQITGTPAGTGTYGFKVQVVDSSTPPQSDTQKLTLTVNKANTTTAITSDSPDPSVVGQPVVVSYAVTAAGGLAPNGNVTVSDGAVSCTATVAAGSCSLTPSTVGDKTLTATYAGDSDCNGSSGTAAHLVNPANTSTTLVSSQNPSVFGQSVTFTATVTTQAPGSGMPTGLVMFFDGAVGLGTAPLNASGQAFWPGSGLSVGAHSIRADYEPPAAMPNFNLSSSSPLSQVVNKADTSTMLTSGTLGVVGQAMTLTFTVTGLAPGSGPTGDVTVSDGTGATCTATVAAGTCALTPTSAGNKTLTAAYAGDSNFNGSVSPGVLVSVNPANTTTSLVSSVNPSILGQAVTFTATVTAQAPGSGIPSGSVRLSWDATQALANLASGQAHFLIPTLSVGTHSFTAQYLGSPSYNASTSPAVPQIVTAPTSASLVFIVQPSNTLAGQVISPAVKVQALDGTGAVIPSINITLTIGTNPSGGTLSGGTVAMTDGTGIAIFPNLSIDNAGNGYTLVASAGVVSAVSNAFNMMGPALISCSYPNGSSGLVGDFIDRGFYVPSYPGSTLNRVDLKFSARTAGTYNLSLTARAGTYGGTLLGTSTATVTLTSNVNAFVPATFSFPSPSVTPGTVTFALAGAPPITVYYGVPSNGDSSCPVIETDGTTPPLDTFRRNGVNVTIY